MKQFIAFVYKEFLHIFRDMRTMLILILLPLVQVLLFGFTLTTEIRNANIAVLDHSKDSSTKAIISHFEGSKYFSIAKNISSQSELDHIFEDGTISFVLVFENSFEKKMMRDGSAVIELLIDASDPNQANMISMYASNIIASATTDFSRKLMAAGLSLDNKITITPAIKMLYNPQGISSYNFVPGVMGLVIMLICAMMTSISIVREKEQGSMEVLLTSPLKPIFILLAKIVPYFTVSFINLVSILLISVFMLDMHIEGTLWLVVAFSILYIFLSLSLGILVSSLAKTQIVAMLVSGLVFMMPVMLLSGMMFPIESMPDPLQWASYIIPARWYVEGLRKVMVAGLSISDIKNEIIILIIMCVVLITVSLKMFKNRLD